MNPEHLVTEPFAPATRSAVPPPPDAAVAVLESQAVKPVDERRRKAARLAKRKREQPDGGGGGRKAVRAAVRRGWGLPRWSLLPLIYGPAITGVAGTLGLAGGHGPGTLILSLVSIGVVLALVRSLITSLRLSDDGAYLEYVTEGLGRTFVRARWPMDTVYEARVLTLPGHLALAIKRTDGSEVRYGPFSSPEEVERLEWALKHRLADAPLAPPRREYALERLE